MHCFILISLLLILLCQASLPDDLLSNRRQTLLFSTSTPSPIKFVFSSSQDTLYAINNKLIDVWEYVSIQNAFRNKLSLPALNQQIVNLALNADQTYIAVSTDLLNSYYYRLNQKGSGRWATLTQNFQPLNAIDIKFSGSDYLVVKDTAIMTVFLVSDSGATELTSKSYFQPILDFQPLKNLQTDYFAATLGNGSLMVHRNFSDPDPCKVECLDCQVIHKFHTSPDSGYVLRVLSAGVQKQFRIIAPTVDQIIDPKCQTNQQQPQDLGSSIFGRVGLAEGCPNTCQNSLFNITQYPLSNKYQNSGISKISASEDFLLVLVLYQNNTICLVNSTQVSTSNLAVSPTSIHLSNSHGFFIGSSSGLNQYQFVNPQTPPSSPNTTSASKSSMNVGVVVGIVVASTSVVAVIGAVVALKFLSTTGVIQTQSVLTGSATTINSQSIPCQTSTSMHDILKAYHMGNKVQGQISLGDVVDKDEPQTRSIGVNTEPQTCKRDPNAKMVVNF